MRLSSALALAAVLASSGLAPRALAQPAPHALPFASQGNALELTVGGTAEAGPVAVEVAEAPPWLTFSAPHATAPPSDAAAEPVARLLFDVASEAPVGEPADVVLHVVDAAGGVLARHVVRVEVAAPAALSVGVPRPNPAARWAVVDVVIPEAVRARASAFDALGREVAVLADGPLAPGAHALRLDTGALAAGAYVVRVVVRDGDGERSVEARRLTVVR